MWPSRSSGFRAEMGCSPPLAVREMCIKITLGLYLIAVRMTVQKQHASKKGTKEDTNALL